MHLDFITCSGTNETTPIFSLLNLLEEFVMAEIGVQVSERTAAEGMPRYKWIHDLHGETMKHGMCINAALHVNHRWVEDLGQGIIAEELAQFLALKDEDGNPFFQRVQLNFKVGREKIPDVDKLAEVMKDYPLQRFILLYNESNRAIVHELYRQGVKFDCLYNASFGRGVLPDGREKPVFADIRQGYAGGITPDNVEHELDKIAKALAKSPNTGGVYIDAQKGLEDASGNLDLGKMLAYLFRANYWGFGFRC